MIDAISIKSLESVPNSSLLFISSSTLGQHILEDGWYNLSEPNTNFSLNALLIQGDSAVLYDHNELAFTFRNLKDITLEDGWTKYNYEPIENNPNYFMFRKNAPDGDPGHEFEAEYNIMQESRYTPGKMILAGKMAGFCCSELKKYQNLEQIKNTK